MPEDQRPVGSGQPGKHDGSTQHTKPSAARTEQYRIAYQEGQRALDDELDELKGTRDRAVQFTAFVGAATAFLVGTGLLHPRKDAVFYGLASTASLLSVMLIVLVIILLVPLKNKKLWNYRISPKILIIDGIERDVPPPNEAAFIRALAMEYDKMYDKNEILLNSLRRTYRWLIAVGCAQVTLWAALVWIRG